MDQSQVAVRRTRRRALSESAIRFNDSSTQVGYMLINRPNVKRPPKLNEVGGQLMTTSSPLFNYIRSFDRQLLRFDPQRGEITWKTVTYFRNLYANIVRRDKLYRYPDTQSHCIPLMPEVPPTWYANETYQAMCFRTIYDPNELFWMNTTLAYEGRVGIVYLWKWVKRIIVHPVLQKAVSVAVCSDTTSGYHVWYTLGIWITADTITLRHRDRRWVASTNRLLATDLESVSPLDWDTSASALPSVALPALDPTPGLQLSTDNVDIPSIPTTAPDTPHPILPPIQVATGSQDPARCISTPDPTPASTAPVRPPETELWAVRIPVAEAEADKHLSTPAAQHVPSDLGTDLALKSPMQIADQVVGAASEQPEPQSLADRFPLSVSPTTSESSFGTEEDDDPPTLFLPSPTLEYMPISSEKVPEIGVRPLGTKTLSLQFRDDQASRIQTTSNNHVGPPASTSSISHSPSHDVLVSVSPLHSQQSAPSIWNVPPIPPRTTTSRWWKGSTAFKAPPTRSRLITPTWPKESSESMSINDVDREREHQDGGRENIHGSSSLNTGQLSNESSRL